MTASLTLVAASAPCALQRASAGDQDAFAELVGQYEGLVFSIALRFFDDRAVAEELAQEVFLQLYQHLRDIESDAHLRFWLRQVTSRRCIDEMRRKRPRGVSLETIADIGVHAPAVDPLLDRRLQRLVAQLPPHQRLVITLRYQEDLELAEVAGILEMPLNTVKSHLHRAVLALRKELGDLS
jgi:RNA polymerase sigma-70 factor (ECF subfamily)